MNASFDFIVDDQGRAIRSLLREFPLGPDVAFRGEVSRLMDLPGFRRSYFKKRHGLTIDAFGELLWSRGVTGRRLSSVEVLDVLDYALVASRRRALRNRPADVMNEIEREALRAAKNRQRKFCCPVCDQIARATRAADLLCGRCYANDGAIIAMRRVEAIPEEILMQAAAMPAEMESAA